MTSQEPGKSSRMKEFDKGKDVLLSQMKESIAKEERRMQRRNEERQKVELLKEKNLLEQAAYITSSKKKKNITSKSTSTNQTNTTCEDGLSDNFHSAYQLKSETSDTWGSYSTNVSTSSVNARPNAWEKKKSPSRGQRPPFENNRDYANRRYDGKKGQYKPSNGKQEIKYSYRTATDAVDAPLPDVNPWSERLAKREEIEQMRPHNEAEEEQMLLSVMELSKKQVLDDQRQRQENQKKYLEQLKFMSENPESVSFMVHPEGSTSPTHSEEQSQNEKSTFKSHGARDRKDSFNSPYHKKPEIIAKETSKKCFNEKARIGMNSWSSKSIRSNDNSLKSNKNIDGRLSTIKTKARNESNVDDGVWGDVEQADDGTWGDVEQADNGTWGDVEQADDGAWGDVEQPNLTTSEEQPGILSKFENYHKSDDGDSENDSWVEEKESEDNQGLYIYNKCDWDKKSKSSANVDLNQEDDRQQFIKAETEYLQHSDIRLSEKSIISNTPEASRKMSQKCNLEQELGDSWEMNAYPKQYESGNFVSKNVSNESTDFHPTESVLYNESTGASSNSGYDLTTRIKNLSLSASQFSHASNTVTDGLEKSESKLTFPSVHDKDAMTNVQEWLVASQKEASSLNYTSDITENTLVDNVEIQKTSIQSQVNLQMIPDQVYSKLPVGFPPSNEVGLSNCISSTGSEAINNVTCTSHPQLNSSPSSAIGNLNPANYDPTGFGPQMQAFNHLLQPNPLLNPASALAAQQMMMCANPLLMQQLYNLQMFYLSMGVPVPGAYSPYWAGNGPVLAPASLPGNIGNNLNDQNMYVNSNISMSPYNGVPSLNGALPQFTSSAHRGPNPSEAVPKMVSTPPGINTSYLQSQFTREEHESMSLPTSLPNNVLMEEECVPIPPPRPARTCPPSENSRQPRQRFNDLYPYSQASSDSPRPK